jgi:hypothetical protein
VNGNIAGSLAKDEDAPMQTHYVSELIASRQKAGDERTVVSIADSGQKGTDVYWCEPIGKWICVSLDSMPQMVTSEDIALIQLHEDTDPEDGLSQRALASDCEREAGLWLIDAEDLEHLVGHYGSALEILWLSTNRAFSRP